MPAVLIWHDAGMTDWVGTAAAYRRSFATLCAGTIEPLLDATGGSSRAGRVRHLDLGCGTGELAVAASRRGRSIVAADPDLEMAALTREALAGHDGSVVLDAGAPTLPIASGAMDAITANFVVNHAPDPRATVRDLVRVAAPGAPVAMTIWTTEPGPHLTTFAAAAEEAGAVPVPSSRLPADRDFPRTAAGLGGIAGEAGLRVERAEELRWTWRIAADDLMAGISAGIAGPGRLHRAQTPAVRADTERGARALWEEFRDGEVLAFPVVAALMVGRA